MYVEIRRWGGPDRYLYDAVLHTASSGFGIGSVRPAEDGRFIASTNPEARYATYGGALHRVITDELGRVGYDLPWRWSGPHTNGRGEDALPAELRKEAAR